MPFQISPDNITYKHIGIQILAWKDFMNTVATTRILPEITRAYADSGQASTTNDCILKLRHVNSIFLTFPTF